MSGRIVFSLFLGALLPADLSAGAYRSTGSAQLFEYPDGTTDLADGSEIGSEGSDEPIAGVFGGALRLTSLDAAHVIGSFKLPDLDPGNVARQWELRLVAGMNKPSNAPPGEGWSINFGNLPPDNGTGEGGFAPLQAGLTISFDTRADDETDEPSIEILVGGITITNIPFSFSFDTTRRLIAVVWDAQGLDLVYDSRALLNNFHLPGFAPGASNRFAFTARSTVSAMEVTLDELRAISTALPVIETGGLIISEFSAHNSNFQDEFGDEPGWIELFNGSNQQVDLTGWYLTDSKRNLTKWRIDGLVLNPFNYQVVFASSRDRQLSATRFLHSNFNLNENDEFVALVKPDGITIASSYEFESQDENVSFGEAGPERTRGYMFPATPGGVNSQEVAPHSRAPAVVYSEPSGLMAAPLEVALSVPQNPAAQIRYTLDRTEPGANSLLYSNPIVVTQITTLRARAYLPDHLPGGVTRATYIMMDGSLTNYAETGKIFESNLPLLYLDSFGTGVDGSSGGSRAFRPIFAAVIPPDPQTGRATLTSPLEFAGFAGAHVRGESSAGFEQKSYSLEFWDENGKDVDAPMLGMPPESDWVLYGPWSEKTLMRNKLIFDWMLALRGHDGTAVRTRFVELFFNQARPSSGRVNFTQSYRGIYVLMEKLKRTKDRVPLESLNDKTIDPELITGGYIIRKDKPDTAKNNWSTPRLGIPMQSYDPDRMNVPQFNYVRSYLADFENALMGANMRNFTNGFRAFIDPDTFIDAQWMVEIAKQVDGYVFSTYFHKDRAGRLRAGPLWDFNIALGNADYGTGDRATGWLYDVPNGAGQLWYPRLHTDPDYKLAHWDRYWQMRGSIFRDEAVVAAIHRNMEELLDGFTGAVSNRMPASVQNPAARHFRRWPRLTLRDWPNPPTISRNNTWQLEVDFMRGWLSNRLKWLDDQSLRSGRLAYRPPVLSHAGGAVAAPIQVTIAPYDREDPITDFPAGEIFYTLDRTDPRRPGGAISTWARPYAGPITIDRSVTINARLRTSTGVWSPLATATFDVQTESASSTNLVVSEIQFRPAALSAPETAAGLVDNNQCEFLELRNIGTRTVDLSGLKFTSGVTFNFDFARSRLLAPGESAVLVADTRAFQLRFPLVPSSKILGQFSGHLDNGGEILTLLANNGEIIAQFRYDDDAPWPTAGDTSGRTLVLKDPALRANPVEPNSWTFSAKPGGTPGASGIGADVFAGDPQNDRDQDGLSDFFEFASGSDPENPGSGFFPEITTDGFVTFSFTRRPQAAGAALSIESSKDLKSWVPVEAALSPLATITHPDGTETQSYRSAGPVNADPKGTLFIRVLAR